MPVSSSTTLSQSHWLVIVKGWTVVELKMPKEEEEKKEKAHKAFDPCSLEDTVLLSDVPRQ